MSRERKTEGEREREREKREQKGVALTSKRCNRNFKETLKKLANSFC